MKNRRTKTLAIILLSFFLYNSSFSSPTLLQESCLRRVVSITRVDLSRILPERTTEGFIGFDKWLEAFENLPDYVTDKLLIAFTYREMVIHSVEFKIPKKEVLFEPGQIKEVADYVANLVLFGMAFIGGDAVVANWSEELRQSVENIFQHSIDVDRNGNLVYSSYRGMIHYLESTYREKYEFRGATREEIENNPRIKMGFLMEVDKAIINMNPQASGFAVPNAGPYGLRGVIEQYTPNQRGIYNLFRELVESDEVFRRELEESQLLPRLEPRQDKQIMRDILLRTQELLESEQIFPETKAKIEKIYEEMGEGLGVTIVIAQRFMEIDNVMITGQAVEGKSGEIIKRVAEEVTQGKVRIWLPGENPLAELEGENTLLQFEIDGSKLSSFGQAVAMAAEISEKIYGQGKITQGVVVGIDCGSSDVKVIFSDKGRIIFTKKYRWDSGNIGDESSLGHKEIIKAIIDLARLRSSLEKLPQTSEINLLKKRVLELEESDGREYNTETERYNAIVDVLKEAENLGIELARIEGIGLSFAGAVIEDQIVGRGSIVSGLSEEGFSEKITPLGRLISEDYNNIPFFVVNDGDASAIMAEMMGLENVIALAFGTSTGGGYR